MKELLLNIYYIKENNRKQKVNKRDYYLDYVYENDLFIL